VVWIGKQISRPILRTQCECNRIRSPLREVDHVAARVEHVDKVSPGSRDIRLRRERRVKRSVSKPYFPTARSQARVDNTRGSTRNLENITVRTTVAKLVVCIAGGGEGDIGVNKTDVIDLVVSGVARTGELTC
jgi:hypothetical protein